ncbi:MAG: HDOD domain-containing protein [Phycisphaerales bacterium]|jgi:HD-like signal output (HDOD) protein/GGDEF domain-containing protein|nr:HDOD domain-containing protein [Phycisphaerales bacterium]
MNPEMLNRVLRCDRLPSLPAIAMRVIELTSDPKVSMKEIAEVIANDQGLSSKVLRTVNSSFYGLAKPCSTINQSIVMLGMSSVKTLALGFSLVSSLKKNANNGFDFPTYWRRGLLTGVAAKCISRAAKLGHEEECFLAGLLQDVGMIAMYEALGDEYISVLAKTGGDHRQLIKLELQELEISHAEVGAMLAARWKLPPELQIPIKFHERPQAAPQDHIDCCYAVSLGNIAADVLCAAEPSVVLKKFYAKCEEWCQITPAKADELMNTISQGAKEVAKLLEVDVASFNDPAAVRAKADEQLLAITVPIKPDAAPAGDVVATIGGSGAPGEVSNAIAGNLDPFTLLPSRVIFSQNLVAMVEQLQAGGGPFSVALLAIDGFADIEAEQGEAYTDAFLRLIGEEFRTLESQAVIPCATDRGSFALVMTATDRFTATRMVENFKARVAAKAIAVKPPGMTSVEIAATFSAGLVTLDDATRARFVSIDAVMDTATRALNAAQNAGSNVLRVFVPKAAA